MSPRKPADAPISLSLVPRPSPGQPQTQVFPVFYFLSPEQQQTQSRGRAGGHQDPGKGGHGSWRERVQNALML